MRTELEMLRENRPTAPAVQVRASHGVTGNLLEAACMLTAKLEQVENLFDEQTLDAADKRFRGGIGLQELLLEAAWANGYTGRNFRDSRAVLRFAFQPELEAGFSTIDIGGILSNVANKFLLEGFFAVERTWRNICAVRNVSDFKTVTSYRLIGKDQYEQVPPGGEIKHGTLGKRDLHEQGRHLRAHALDRSPRHHQRRSRRHHHGAAKAGTRFGAEDQRRLLGGVPEELGRSSRRRTRTILTGAATGLGIDGLTTAEVAFMDQVDSDNKPIGIMPAILLVPTSLSAMGTQLFKSLEFRDNTANKSYPINNPHQGKFRVEVSRYLSNKQYTGYSSKAWYLLADPADLPVIEVAFLNGQESPTIETAEADFSVLGIQLPGLSRFWRRQARSARRREVEGRSLSFRIHREHEGREGPIRLPALRGLRVPGGAVSQQVTIDKGENLWQLRLCKKEGRSTTRPPAPSPPAMSSSRGIWWAWPERRSRPTRRARWRWWACSISPRPPAPARASPPA